MARILIRLLLYVPLVLVALAVLKASSFLNSTVDYSEVVSFAKRFDATIKTEHQDAAERVAEGFWNFRQEHWAFPASRAVAASLVQVHSAEGYQIDLTTYEPEGSIGASDIRIRLNMRTPDSFIVRWSIIIPTPHHGKISWTSGHSSKEIPAMRKLGVEHASRDFSTEECLALEQRLLQEKTSGGIHRQEFLQELVLMLDHPAGGQYARQSRGVDCPTKLVVRHKVDEIVPLLLSRLRQNQMKHPLQGVKLLGELKSGDSVPFLIEVLKRTKSGRTAVEVGEAIASILADQRSLQVVPLLFGNKDLAEDSGYHPLPPLLDRILKTALSSNADETYRLARRLYIEQKDVAHAGNGTLALALIPLAIKQAPPDVDLLEAMIRSSDRGTRQLVVRQVFWPPDPKTKALMNHLRDFHPDRIELVDAMGEWRNPCYSPLLSGPSAERETKNWLEYYEKTLAEWETLKNVGTPPKVGKEFESICRITIGQLKECQRRLSATPYYPYR